jgi:hypothetical protein
MRVALAVAILLVTGCGGAEGHKAAAPEAPPRVVLETVAGRQRAVQESSCVETTGTAVCGDTTQLEPRQLTRVRRGDTVTLRLDRGEMVSGAGGPSATVRAFGCRDELERVDLAAGGRWRVDLDPGDYSIDVFTRFSAGDAKGDTSGVVGLEVTTAGRREIVPARAPRAMGC